jgi:hypothetical protein
MSVNLKICAKCKQNKSYLDFHKDTKKKDGLFYCCKDCAKKQVAIWRLENPEKVKMWYKNNPQKINERSRQWAKSNPEKAKNKYTKWKNANPDKVKAKEINYRKNNSEKIKAAGIAWRKANPDKVSNKTMRRVAAKLQRTPKWLTKTQLKEIQEFYSSASRITKITGIPYQVDHIIPLRGKEVSGLHVPWNLQILPKCGPNGNYSKGNRIL